jgi:formylglycine-generating enzyme required for sulfatase activity
VIPGTVRIIKNNAFDAFPKLKKITFSEGLVEIEDDAFASCRQLEAVEFPRSLRKIGPRAFNDCDKLHSIVLKEGLETIGDHAFSKTSPKKVIFPNSLKSLGLVFEDCRELEAIVFLGDRPVATGKRISQRTRATVYYNPLKKHWGKRPTGVYMGRLPVSTTHHYMMNLKNGRPWGLYELTFRGGYKDNEMHGLCTWWYKNGQKKKEGTYKDGQPDGLFVEWYPNGQKKGEGTYKDGQPVTAALVWKPNGEKCPASNLVNGNGVVVVYNDDGTEDFRITFLRWPVQPPNKNGEPSPAPAPASGTPRPKPRTPPKKVSPAPVNPSTSEVVGKLFTIPDLSMDMLWVKPGTFEMGSPSSEKDRDDDETQHTVTLTSGFYLGKHEVTQAQWEKVMGSNPSYFKGASRPVEKLSWNGASAFCEKLTELERKAGRLPEGMSYQLPTEAQWEYACRAGTETRFAFGDELTAKDANFDKNVGETSDVGKYPANDWGFHDMHGNVYEWCADWSGDYPRGATRDPVGPATGSVRVWRGGSWHFTAYYARSALRFRFVPDLSDFFLGFRLSLRPPASK